MAGLYADAHITCLLLDDRHGHRASRTNHGDPVVKIPQLAFPLEMGRDRPKSLDNRSQDLIAVTAGGVETGLIEKKSKKLGQHGSRSQ